MDWAQLHSACLQLNQQRVLDVVSQIPKKGGVEEIKARLNLISFSLQNSSYHPEYSGLNLLLRCLTTYAQELRGYLKCYDSSFQYIYWKYPELHTQYQSDAIHVEKYLAEEVAVPADQLDRSYLMLRSFQQQVKQGSPNPMNLLMRLMLCTVRSEEELILFKRALKLLAKFIDKESVSIGILRCLSRTKKQFTNLRLLPLLLKDSYTYQLVKYVRQSFNIKHTQMLKNLITNLCKYGFIKQSLTILKQIFNRIKQLCSAEFYSMVAVVSQYNKQQTIRYWARLKPAYPSIDILQWSQRFRQQERADQPGTTYFTNQRSLQLLSMQKNKILDQQIRQKQQQNQKLKQQLQSTKLKLKNTHNMLSTKKQELKRLRAKEQGLGRSEFAQSLAPPGQQKRSEDKPPAQRSLPERAADQIETGKESRLGKPIEVKIVKQGRSNFLYNIILTGTIQRKRPQLSGFILQPQVSKCQPGLFAEQKVSLLSIPHSANSAERQLFALLFLLSRHKALVDFSDNYKDSIPWLQPIYSTFFGLNNGSRRTVEYNLSLASSTLTDIMKTKETVYQAIINKLLEEKHCRQKLFKAVGLTMKQFVVCQQQHVSSNGFKIFCLTLAGEGSLGQQLNDELLKPVSQCQTCPKCSGPTNVVSIQFKEPLDNIIINLRGRGRVIFEEEVKTSAGTYSLKGGVMREDGKEYALMQEADGTWLKFTEEGASQISKKHDRVSIGQRSQCHPILLWYQRKAKKQH